jgi:uroporphyrinogen decarboxylase
MMTDLENFYATTEHQNPGRIFYGFGMTDDLQRRMIAHIGTDKWGEHFGIFMPVGIGPERPESLPKPDYARYWEGQKLPEGTVFDGFGVAMVPSGFYHFWGYISPLRNAQSLKEIEDFPMDDISRYDFSKMAETARVAHAQGKVVTGWVGHMYESAWQIRGLEEFLMDVIERPAWAECLLEKLAQHNRLRAVAAAKAGADYLTTGDDVANQQAMMFSPDVWRKLMHSRWAKIWREVKAVNPRIKLWYHSDGNILDIVDDLVDAGLDILNPLQPECLDIDAIYKRYGKRLSFDGTIGTQSTMPFGTPADVRARVKEVIQKFGRHGGLLVNPTHVLEPEVPIANIEALCQACRDFGTFE